MGIRHGRAPVCPSTREGASQTRSRRQCTTDRGRELPEEDLPGRSTSPSRPLPPALPAKLPIGAIAPWVFFFGILMLVLLYFVGAEQGATSGEYVHEWAHDAHHLLGFPCH